MPPASGKVIVLSAVGFVTVSVVSLPTAPLPSKTIFPLARVIELAASVEPDINVVPIKVVDVKDETPAIVVAVPPRDIEVLPTVTAELARLLLAIDDAVDNIVPVSYTHLTLPTKA